MKKIILFQVIFLTVATCLGQVKKIEPSRIVNSYTYKDTQNMFVAESKFYADGWSHLRFRTLRPTREGDNYKTLVLSSKDFNDLYNLIMDNSSVPESIFELPDGMVLHVRWGSREYQTELDLMLYDSDDQLFQSKKIPLYEFVKLFGRK